jgi:hypothetical protein
MIRRLSLDDAREASREDWAMDVAAALFLLTCLYPLGQAFRANWRTSLNHSLAWAGIAWLGWSGLLACALFGPERFTVTLSYLALVTTACAGIAVLGARRPGVMGWNLVIIGLLAVLLLPLAEGWGDLRLSFVRIVFLAVTLAVVPFNYLPTRMGLAALALAVGCGLELYCLVGHAGLAMDSAPDWIAGCGRLLVAVSPWIAWGLMKAKPIPASEFDRVWLDFRDRFGLTWSLRLREQFNCAGANAGWHSWLGWSGLQGPVEEVAQPDKLETLKALLKRFGIAPSEGM